MTPERLKWLLMEAEHAERVGQVGISLSELQAVVEAAGKAQRLEAALTEIARADFRGNRSWESSRAHRALEEELHQ